MKGKAPGPVPRQPAEDFCVGHDNGQPVAKLSDSPEKNMCEDQAYLAYLRQVFEIKQPEARIQ